MRETIHADKPLIMMIGIGDLSSRVLNMLLTSECANRVVLAGRSLDVIRQRANLVRFTANNLGFRPEIRTVEIDLRDVARTAETIARVQPDIIFMGASLQSWRVITALPPAVFAELDSAQFGPWLPMHLTLNYFLMQAVRQTGLNIKVVNAAFPDAVGPVLAKAELAPTVGIGNVANIVPALTYAYADHSVLDPSEVEIQLVAHHNFSHYVPRFGSARRGTYHISAKVRGSQISHEFPAAEIFHQLTGPYKRQGGVEGQLLTASSAMRVLAAMAADTGGRAHAPAPGGLPGGYPVRVGREGATLDLPPSVSVVEAIAINEAGQRADGIDRIEDDATVVFTEREMAVMKRLLGYECRAMKLADVEDWSNELGSKYREFSMRWA
jgi:hypothetical protein